VPGSKHALEEKVLPFLRDASTETKRAFLQNPRVSLQHAKELEDSRAHREMLRKERETEIPLVTIGKRMRSKLVAIEGDLDVMRREDLFPLLPKFQQQTIRSIIEKIQEHLTAILKGTGRKDGPPLSEKRLAGLLEKTEDWELSP
jgi:hypothetical protein